MSSSFPMPLTEEDEISCLEKLSSGDMSARETLIKHNLRLVAHKGHRHLQQQQIHPSCHLCFQMYRKRNTHVHKEHKKNQSRGFTKCAHRY